MNKIKYLLIFLLSFLSCNQEIPIQFTEDALNDTFTTIEGKNESLKNILTAHKGKTIIVDIWASWCGDCIKGMPKVKALQEAYPEAIYIFLSLDKTEKAWKKGIKKYNVQGEHYFMQSGKGSAFGKFVNIDWIPRYMVVGSEGKIKLFKAVEADDKKIKQSLIN
ncbi:redoxin [Flavivirga aquatica]|uniref:Redoxin n=1 Tax=Flavivirga aquatica TaxID=1849968 RepID=A0A1E5TBP1_9FLAO|nr:TlpA disulfide reductase family protein [Flavivirga aquatica]OEK08770.1 redoxin [Flavivirga aquatica]